MTRTIYLTSLGFDSSSLSEWVKVAQSCLTLCDPMDRTVHGVLQARILEWVAFPFFRASQPRDRIQVSHIAGRFFTSWATGKPSLWNGINLWRKYRLENQVSFYMMWSIWNSALKAEIIWEIATIKYQYPDRMKERWMKICTKGITMFLSEGTAWAKYRVMKEHNILGEQKAAERSLSTWGLEAGVGLGSKEEDPSLQG